MTELLIGLKTPCCTRVVRGAALMHHAVQVIRRSCPKCRVRWQVILRPIGEPRPGMWVHIAEWTR